MRDRLEITADILSVAKNPSNKTNIVYDANLSFEQAGRYLEKCVDSGLLEVEEGSSKKYVTTEKGYEFLKAFKEIEEIIDLGRSNSTKTTISNALFQ